MISVIRITSALDDPLSHCSYLVPKQKKKEGGNESIISYKRSQRENGSCLKNTSECKT